MQLGSTCLLIDENPNNRVLLQREFGREFPNLPVYQASPAQPADDWLPPGVQPTLCIVDWALVSSGARNVVQELEVRWPRVALLVFCGRAIIREQFELERRGLSLRVCGVASDFEDMMRLAKLELSRAQSITAVRDERLPANSTGTPIPPRHQIEFLNSLPFGVALVNSRTRHIHFANNALLQWFGLPPANESTLRIEDVHPGESARRMATSLRAVQRGIRPESVDAAISVTGKGGVVLDVVFGDTISQEESLVSIFYLDATERRAVERKLRRMADSVANAASGQEFFRSLVSGLALVLEVDIALVCRVQPGDVATVQSLATFVDGEITSGVAMPVAGFPAERVLKHQLICVAKHFQKEFPHATWMTEQRVESFMGLPITGVSGEVIGMIQVMDRKPLTKTKDLRAVLLIFATRVAAEMTRLANEEALAERERLMREAESISGLGSWEWSIAADRLTLSEEGLKIIGWPTLPPLANLEWGIGLLHPDDRSKAHRMVENAVGGQSAFEEILRLLRPDGELRWLQVRGKLIRGAQEKTGRLAGIFLDVTEKRKLFKHNEAFSRLGRLLSAAKTKVEAARIIIQVAEQMFDVDAAAFALRDAKSPGSFGSILNIDTIDGTRKEFEPIPAPSAPSPLQERVLMHGAQLIRRNQEEGRNLTTIPFGAVTRRSATILVVPIRHEHECIGVCSIHSYRPNAYSDDDLAALQSLVDYSAGAFLRIDAEEEAQKNHGLLRLVIDSLPAYVAYVDENQRYLMVNRRYEQWLGRTRAEIEGQPANEVLPPHIYQLAHKHMERALLGEALDYEVTPDPARGITSNLHVNYVPHVLPSGKVAGFVGLLTDISSVRSTERQLQESLARTQFIVDNAAAVVFLKDAVGRYVMVNKLWESVTGLERHNVIGKRFEDLHSPSTADQLISDARVFESREPVESEEIIERHGVCRIFLTIKFPLLDTSGKVYGLCGIATDITRRKEMEHSLRQVTRRLETAQRIAHVGNWEWNIATQTMWWSEETYRLLGVIEGSFVPTRESFLSLVHPEDKAAVKRVLSQSMADHSHYSVLHRIVRPDGAIRYLQQNGEVIVNDEGKPTAVNGVIQDVTERHLTEIALRASEEKFRVQFQAMPLPTFIWKFNGDSLTLTETNPAGIKFTHGLFNLIVGKTTLEIFPDAPDIVEDFHRCYRERCYFARELAGYRMRTTGKVKHLRGHMHYVAPDMVVLHVDDMTERLETEARQRAMLKLIPYRLFRLDRHGVFLDYHASREEEMLLDPNVVIGKNFRDVLPRDASLVIEGALARAASTGQVQVVHYTLPKSSSIHYLEARMINCGNSEFLAMVQDISEADYRQAIAPPRRSNDEEA